MTAEDFTTNQRDLMDWGDSRRRPTAKQSKQEMREQTGKLVKEALERKLVSVKKVDGRRDESCGRCGALNRIEFPAGQLQVSYKCQWCGQQQKTI